jgi:3-isopropylmalate/(R)-2-methylmalate dehydratase large subunit
MSNNHDDPKTLFDKLWDAHVVVQEKGAPAILYVDAQLVHEVTSPQAFESLRKKGLAVYQPEKTYATTDHNVPTRNQNEITDILSKHQVETMEKNAREFGIHLYGLDSPYQGIVHVIGPELGITQPGKTIVCGDSHTSTHGAFGALAWGIGTSEIETVLATQCILQHKPKTMNIKINGTLKKGVTAKDVILFIIREIGTNGAKGYAVEYSGSVISDFDMEERMTICNMSVEAGGRMGMIAPDQKTFEYLKGRQFVAKSNAFNKAVRQWKTLQTDTRALFDRTVVINGSEIVPMVTYGTNPAQCMGIHDTIPHPSDYKNESERKNLIRALSYMGFKPGIKLAGLPIQNVFIGSCTNGRLSDLREAAHAVKGKTVRKNVFAYVVPGSRSVKRVAEKEGLDKIFLQAGFEWRWPGCSSCVAINEDKIPSGEYCLSTSNRNYEGRQGPGARTLLVSPATAALSAVNGALVDVREYLS